MEGKLFLCGTPIGNLDDITYRVVETLKNCDVIYAEDTRHSLRLLNHLGIKKPLYSYHAHNLETAGFDIIKRIQSGELVALVTDAGMPGISDPGEDLVAQMLSFNLPFEVIPGVTAFSTALVGSGLKTGQFVFEGFLSRDKRQKKKHVERLKHEWRTIIFYEAPHRLKETLEILSAVFGNREAVVARELTKRYEEYRRDTLGNLCTYYSEHPAKGEIVLMVAGISLEALEAVRDAAKADYPEDLYEHYRMLCDAGMPDKAAMKEVAVTRGMKRSEVYAIVVAHKK